MISISLLFSVTLSLKYPAYGDAWIEYYYAHLVYKNGIWDPSIPGNHNAMLRITILHPIYSLLLNIELSDVFRIVHPLLYSITPLAVYISFKRQTNEKIAFLSSFFFTSVFSFYVMLSRNTRTGIAELFIALFILLMTDKNITGAKRSLLSLIFVSSVIVSHYGTSYVFMFALISSTLLLFLMNTITRSERRNENEIIHLNFCITYIVLVFVWYFYNASSTTFNTLVGFISHMMAQMSEFLSPEVSYTVYALSRNWPFSIEISRDLLLISSILITIGVVDLVWSIIKGKKMKFQDEFIAFSISFFGILLATLLPTKGLNPARVLHLSLCFLAPFVTIGFIKICKILCKSRFNRNDKFNIFCLQLFSIFLMVFLLFNSGFVSEAIIKGKDYSPNIVISKPRALDIHDAQYIYSLRREIISDQEVFAGRWLIQQKDMSVRIYLERGAERAFIGYIIPIIHLNQIYQYIESRSIIKEGYMFLDKDNVVRRVSIAETYPPKISNLNDVYPLNISNKIYTNSGSEIYYR